MNEYSISKLRQTLGAVKGNMSQHRRAKHEGRYGGHDCPICVALAISYDYFYDAVEQRNRE